MKRLIGQPHLIFSVENPRFAVTQKGINHGQALNWLKDLGENVIDSDGKYGSEEPSIIISNPKHKESILKLARDAGQESIIYSDGKRHKIIYLNGPQAGQMVSGEGTVFHDQKPNDNYTHFKDQNGKDVYFTHNFDFGKSEELDKGAMGDWQKEGYKITHKGDPKDLSTPLEISAMSPSGEIVGKVSIGRSIKTTKKGKQLILTAIPRIHEEHRRKGLASSMYQYAENITGGKVEPDVSTTLAAKKMWAKPDRPFGGKHKYFQHLISKTEDLDKAKKEEQRKIFGSYGSKKGKKKYIEIVENFARNKLNIEPVKVASVDELETKYGRPIQEIPDSIKAENYWKKAGSTGKYIFKPSFFEKDGKWHVAHLGTEKSLIHELAHIIRANKSIPELDAAMQRGFGAIKVSGLKASKEAKAKGATEKDLIEARKKSNQFAYPGEYETMGLEQMISRYLGLPANTTYSYIENEKNPPKNVQVSMKTGEPIHRKVPTKSGQTKHLTHLSENVPQELKDKFNRFISGQIVYNPNKGWEESGSINSKINRRQEKLQQQSNKSFNKEELDKGAKGDWQKEGYSIKHQIFPNGLYIQAFDPKGKHAGSVRLSIKNDSLHPDYTEILPEHQRKGLASSMYNYAKDIIDKKTGKQHEIVRGETQSEQSKALWSQPNRPFGKSEDLDKGAKGDWQKEGYKIKINKEDSVIHSGPRVSAIKNGKEVGFVRIVPDGKHITAYDTYVNKKHRRKGLVNAMYFYAEKALNKKFKSAKLQTKEGETFWKQPNRPFGKSEELDKLTKGFEELFGFLAKAKANIIYIATDGDNIGASVERAALSNDIKEIKKQDKIIKRGNQAIRKWIKKRHGSIYIDGGDDISFTIHKKYLDEIEELRNKYHEATGYTITVGVGDSISEAAHAMIYGKLKGKNQVNKWTPEIESIISQHDKKPETAEEKYQKEGLLAQKSNK